MALDDSRDPYGISAGFPRKLMKVLIVFREEISSAKAAIKASACSCLIAWAIDIGLSMILALRLATSILTRQRRAGCRVGELLLFLLSI